ncbi:MAG: recombinase family protein [Eubacteriales bacterium]|nr:recombinase family protein [Eubacteriales bacterium]
MANRYIPFGYLISDGKMKIIETEAEVIRNVFSLYVQGDSFKTISDKLNLLPITYADDGRAWNKNIVKRMIENKKYVGDKEYPSVIPAETFTLANSCKEKRTTNSGDKHTHRLEQYGKVLKCSQCGSKMTRSRTGKGEKRRIYWKCSNCDCDGYKHMLNHKSLEMSVANLLNTIADDTSIIKTSACTGFETNTDVIYAENQLNDVLQNNEAEFKDVVDKIFRLTDIKFRLCKNADNTAVSEKIEKCFIIYPKSEIADLNIVNEIIRKIKISPDKEITIELINDRIFEERV